MANDDNVNVNIVELASELAHYRTVEQMLNDGSINVEQQVWSGWGSDCAYYTDQAQDIFNEHYDHYYEMIEQCKL